MSKCNKTAMVSAMGLFLAALPTLAKETPKVYPSGAEIENTGSTNTVGYNLGVVSDGSIVRVYTSRNTPIGTKPWIGQTIIKPVNISSTVVDGHISKNPPAVDKFFAGKTMVKLPSITVQYASKFFHDLEAAMPLTNLPVSHGMRSASFGTQTYVSYKGQKSPDLTFASDPRSVALKADIDAITKALHIGNTPRRPVTQTPQSETH